MTRKLFLLTVLTMVALAPLSACEEGAEKDPFKTVTLQEVTRSTVVSKGYKYKLVNPTIVAMNRNLGLIRDGNIIEFIGARGLEDKLAGRMDGYLELNVTKKFSPYVHFRVESFATDTDTVMTNQRGALALPAITTAEAYGISAYEERDIDAIPYNNTGALRNLVDKKIMVKSKLVKETLEGRDTYYLVGEGAKLRIGDTSDAIGLMIKLLDTSDYMFEGGVTLTEVEPFSDRRNTRIAGTVTINFLMYGDQLITS